ncbi:MAG: AI-2E family transporter [Clostridia bacterium]|nr:AI-2E family transporter [Clostridia bacterium]
MREERSTGGVWQERGGKVICAGAILGVVYGILQYALGVLTPFLIALVLACLLSPVAERLAKVSRLPRKLCAVWLVCFLLLLSLAFLSALIGRFVREAETLLLRLSTVGSPQELWAVWYLRLPAWMQERLEALWSDGYVQDL